MERNEVVFFIKLSINLSIWNALNNEKDFIESFKDTSYT